jgi:hypothetical protein
MVNLTSGSRIVTEVNEAMDLKCCERSIRVATIEELIELSNDIFHSDKKENILKNVADAQVMIWQIMFTYGISSQELSEVMYDIYVEKKVKIDMGEL